MDNSNKHIETLIRHKFYSGVDWDACAGMNLEFLESEFRAIIQWIAGSFASELTDDSIRNLEDQMISEVCIEDRIDSRVFGEYRIRVTPTVPFTTRLSNQASRFLFWLTGEKRRTEQGIETAA